VGQDYTSYFDRIFCKRIFGPTFLVTDSYQVDGKALTPVLWLREGSTLEDESNLLGIPTRSLNHFHDPTKPLDQAGLNDTFTGMSAKQFIDKKLPTIPVLDFDKAYLGYSIGKKTTTGEALDCLAKPSLKTADYYRVFGAGEWFYGSFIQDEACFKEQTSKLLPRAVGYSVAMLDYFYRGKLTVTVPEDTPPTSSRIRLKVHNSTPTGETMDSGSIDLMVIFRQYKKNGTDSAGTLVPPPKNQ
jgi:hypothetical protein